MNAGALKTVIKHTVFVHDGEDGASSNSHALRIN